MKVSRRVLVVSACILQSLSCQSNNNKTLNATKLVLNFMAVMLFSHASKKR